MLRCLPKLWELAFSGYEKITGLGVVEQPKEETVQGLLLLPLQLQKLSISFCPELSLRADSP